MDISHADRRAKRMETYKIRWHRILLKLFIWNLTIIFINGSTTGSPISQNVTFAGTTSIGNTDGGTSPSVETPNATTIGATSAPNNDTVTSPAYANAISSTSGAMDTETSGTTVASNNDGVTSPANGETTSTADEGNNTEANGTTVASNDINSTSPSNETSISPSHGPSNTESSGTTIASNNNDMTSPANGVPSTTVLGTVSTETSGPSVSTNDDVVTSPANGVTSNPTNETVTTDSSGTTVPSNNDGMTSPANGETTNIAHGVTTSPGHGTVNTEASGTTVSSNNNAVTSANEVTSTLAQGVTTSPVNGAVNTGAGGTTISSNNDGDTSPTGNTDSGSTSVSSNNNGMTSPANGGITTLAQGVTTSPGHGAVNTGAGGTTTSSNNDGHTSPAVNTDSSGTSVSSNNNGMTSTANGGITTLAHGVTTSPANGAVNTGAGGTTTSSNNDGHTSPAVNTDSSGTSVSSNQNGMTSPANGETSTHAHGVTTSPGHGAVNTEASGTTVSSNNEAFTSPANEVSTTPAHGVTTSTTNGAVNTGAGGTTVASNNSDMTSPSNVKDTSSPNLGVNSETSRTTAAGDNAVTSPVVLATTSPSLVPVTTQSVQSDAATTSYYTHGQDHQTTSSRPLTQATTAKNSVTTGDHISTRGSTAETSTEGNAATTGTINIETTASPIASLPVPLSALGKKMVGPTSPSITPDYGLVFQETIFKSVYVSENGLVVVRKHRYPTVAAQPFPTPPTIDLQQYTPEGFENAVFLAAYWSNMIYLDTEDDSGVFYKIFNTKEEILKYINGSELHQKLGELNLSPDYTIVVTWSLARQSVNSTETVTIQMFIITDGQDTLVAFFYGEGRMNWVFTLDPSVQQNAPVRIGVMVRCGGKCEEFTNEANMSYPTLNDLSRLENIDEQLTATKGFIFNSFTSKGKNFTNPGLKCRDWITRDEAEDYKGRGLLNSAKGKCPATDKQVTRQYKLVKDEAGMKTYHRTFARSSVEPTWTSQCIYYSEGENAGALVTSELGVCQNQFIRIANNTEQEPKLIDACQACLKDSTIHREDFLRRRPVSTSNSFMAPSLGSSIGDPHLTTLDGLQYSFNGYGEYTLINSTTLVLQGRTGLAYTTNPPPRATVFIAFAVRQLYPTSDTIMIALNETSNTLDVYVNGIRQTSDLSESGKTFTNVLVVENGTHIDMIFDPSDVSIRVTNTGLNLTLLAVTVPASLKTETSGLLGNFNDDKTDDLRYFNDTSIPMSSTESDTFEVGQSWVIEPSQSLFTYFDGESAETYGNKSYVPLFFDLNTMFPDNATLQSAISVCGGEDKRECLFDIALTGNEAVGAATGAAAEEVDSSREDLGNYPPVIHTNISSINIVAGQSLNPSIFINATDPNAADNVSYALGSETPSGVAINSASGEITWTTGTSDIPANASVHVIVTDGKASSVLVIAINSCNCQNGTCAFDETVDGQVPCTCNSGYEGAYCERDIDGCADSPCFPNVACTDKTAPLTGFTCGPCPTGYEGDGSVCTEKDECKETPSPCSQKCRNLPRSYECSCDSGYVLTADLKTCQDVDECARGTDGCPVNTVCQNTAGGYQCNCKDGYEKKSNAVCGDIDECASNTSPCQAENTECVNTDGSFTCPCKNGYSFDQEKGTCVEVDECLKDNACSQICIDGIAGYNCSCNTGYQLSVEDNSTCIPDQICTPSQASTCSNEGLANTTCAVVDGTPTCTCPVGYQLDASKKCVDKNECVLGTHQCNLVASSCVNIVGGYECKCNSGYKQGTDQRTCVDVNECTEMNNDTNRTIADCDTINGVCENTAGGYSCGCLKGYTLGVDGKTCTDKNECESPATNDCDADYGVCNNTNGSYKCYCKEGYAGDGYVCSDKNECGLPDRGGCAQGCTNSLGSYSCYCGVGYKMNADGKNCDDVDECAQTSDNGCFGNCQNTAGSFICSCPDGLTLGPDRKTCTSTETCSANTTCSHTCVVLNGTDTCLCPGGYSLDGTGKTCVDINECLSNVCDSDNNVKCVNIVGAYECACVNASYERVTTYRCIDVDECKSGAANCPANSLCTNAEPGYSCQCKEGYKKNGATCEDIDECTLATHLCNQKHGICSNTAGAYTCACKSGYEGDGVTCTDVDECARSDAGGCDVLSGKGLCVNYEGGFNCSCLGGYVLDAQGKICNDVNECMPSQPQHSCHQNCENIDGGYRCSCMTGFVLDSNGINCTVGESCPANNNCSQLCAMVSGQQTCVCQNNFYELSSDGITCVDVNECNVSNPCIGAPSRCENMVGGYKCTCVDGYKLHSDQLTCKDRDGGFSAWGNFTECSCTEGTQSRNRTCDNPTPVGRGQSCSGSFTETTNCTCTLNDVETNNGVFMTAGGISVAQLAPIRNNITDIMVIAVNNHCNGTGFSMCCPGHGRRTTDSDLMWTNSTHFETKLVKDNGQTRLLAVAKAPKANMLCLDGSIQPTRRRRGITYDSNSEMILDQSTLQAILDTASLNSELVSLIKAEYPSATVTIIISAVPTTSPSTVIQTTPSTTFATLEGGLPGWAIALIVLTILLLIGVVLVLVFFLVKKPSKVENLQTEKSTVQQVEMTSHATLRSERSMLAVGHA